MTMLLLMFTSAVSMNACSAAVAGSQMDGKEVTVTGLLVFSRHSAHLIEPGHTPAKTQCLISTIFPVHQRS